MNEKEQLLIPSPVENRARSISEEGLSVWGLDQRPLAETFPREDATRFKLPSGW